MSAPPPRSFLNPKKFFLNIFLLLYKDKISNTFITERGGGVGPESQIKTKYLIIDVYEKRGMGIPVCI